jgi:hypothetical protein
MRPHYATVIKAIENTYMLVDLWNFVKSGLIHQRRINFLFRGNNHPIRSCTTSGISTIKTSQEKINPPLIPREVLPAATALSAYSICTSFPDGEKVVREKL